MFERTHTTLFPRPHCLHVVAAFAIALTAALSSTSVEAQLGAGGLQGGNANRDHMKIVGWWGGPVRDVAVEGDVAVCAIGTRVVVLDVSDQMNPQRMAEFDFEFTVREVELRGGYAYAVTSSTVSNGNFHQFTIIDVRDPASAEIVYFSPPRDAGGGWGGNDSIQYKALELYGPYALVLGSFERIDVYDITVPDQPVFLQQCSWPHGAVDISEMVVLDGYLILLDYQPGGDIDHINIYNLDADVFNPPLVSSTPVDGDLPTLAVEGDFLAALDTQSDSVLVFNISDPTNPILTGTATDFTLSLSDVSISNGYLCVADSAIVGWTGGEPWWNLTEGLSIYDIWNDPGVPELVSTFKTHGATRGVVTVGTTAYTFDDGEGLVLVDIENPNDPQRLGTYYSPSTLRQMTKVGEQLYVTDEWNGFTILDVSTPARPNVTGVYQSPEWGYADHFGIAVRDNWAVFAAGYGGIHVVDVSDPMNPTLASEYEVGTQRQLGGVEIDGDLVRIGWWNRLSNLRFENPPNLTHVGTVQVDFAPAMAIATTDEGITHLAHNVHTVVDNTGPANPIRRISDLAVRSIDLVLDGDYVYTNHQFDNDIGGGFYVRNISDPANPKTVWYFPMNAGQTVARHGSRVFFTAAGGNGSEFPEGVLCQFDASNPESPVLVNYLRVQGTANQPQFGLTRLGSLDLLAEEGVVYATTTEGLAIIQVGGPRRPKAAMSILGQ